MIRLKNNGRMTAFILSFALCISMLSFAANYTKASAAEKNIEFDAMEMNDYTVSLYDTGIFSLINYSNEIGDIESITWSVSDENIMKVTNIEDFKAKYEALAYGDVTVIAEITTKETWDETGDENPDIYESSEDMDDEEVSTYYEKLEFSVFVYPDMSNVKLSSLSQTKYLSENDYNVCFDFELDSDILLDSSDPNSDFSVQSSNSSMPVSAELKNNVVSIWAYKPGKTTVTFSIYGADFNVDIKVVKVSINKKSLMLVKGKNGKLTIKGISKGVKWKSSRTSVVKVNSNGKLSAKRVGTSVIIADVNGAKVGCAVSVVSPKTYKVIKRAKSIAKGKYSQARRMQKGYYDCSSLVWRAYSPYGTNFGVRNYAPVAADICKWCVSKGKKISNKLTESQIQNMKLRAGDLVFKTGAKNGRYKGIYHVEMFAGYSFAGFSLKGKPILTTEWANRTTGYYALGSIVTRP